jgi:hypothetical protein
MLDDTKEIPIFGQPIERERGRGRSPVKGQRKMGLERQLPPPGPEILPLSLARRRILIEARRMEAKKTGWEELVLNEGTRDEIRMSGRYYELDKGVVPLGLFNIPPRTGRATRVGSLVGRDNVFVIKDSEKSDEPRRKGWAGVIVLAEAPPQGGQEPRVRKFNDGKIDGLVVCTALYQGIIERQVLK